MSQSRPCLNLIERSLLSYMYSVFRSALVIVRVPKCAETGHSNVQRRLTRLVEEEEEEDE